MCDSVQQKLCHTNSGSSKTKRKEQSNFLFGLAKIGYVFILENILIIQGLVSA